MAVQKIEYQNKEAMMDDPTIPEKNKVTADDMNEIKSVVNHNADEFNDLDLSSYQTKDNLVTSISSTSTDEQYVSAKCVYTLIGDIDTALDTINGEVIS